MAEVSKAGAQVGSVGRGQRGDEGTSQGSGAATLRLYWTCRVPWLVPALQYTPAYVCAYNALSPEPMTVAASGEGTGWGQGPVAAHAFFQPFGFLFLHSMTSAPITTNTFLNIPWSAYYKCQFPGCTQDLLNQNFQLASRETGRFQRSRSKNQGLVYQVNEFQLEPENSGEPLKEGAWQGLRPAGLPLL